MHSEATYRTYGRVSRIMTYLKLTAELHTEPELPCCEYLGTPTHSLGSVKVPSDRFGYFESEAIVYDGIILHSFGGR